MCKFVLAWRGQCCTPPLDGEDYCIRHLGLHCQCGEPATRECEQTCGMVCGAYICDKCEHLLTIDGCNSSECVHIRPEDQKYKPWFDKDFVIPTDEERRAYFEERRKLYPLISKDNNDVQPKGLIAEYTRNSSTETGS